MDEIPENPDEAFLVETEIRHENGQWVVYLDVLFLDRAVHHKINAYPTRRKAEIAADWIKRAASRDSRFRPPQGF